MIRKAILLSASASTIPSSAAALQAGDAWQSFLLSNSGGCWADQELTTLKNPDRDAILAAVHTARNADYCLLMVTGRGEIRKGDLPWPEAHTLLSDGSSISEAELNPGSPRCTLIFDWSNSASIQPELPGGNAGQARNQSRALFDQAVQKAERGLAKIYASDKDDPSQGASFSALLLHAAQEWTRSNHGTLSLQQAVSLVMDASPPALKAEYHGGRRLGHFPFAVNPPFNL